MKILLFVPVWQRPEVTRSHMQNVERLMGYAKGVKIVPFYVVSEDWAADLCKEFGFHFVYTKNEPLGRKLNKGLFVALKTKWDWLAATGSDNFTEPELFTEFAPHLETLNAFGLNRITMVETGRMKEVSNPYPFGAYRCLRRDVVEQSAYNLGDYVGLWDYQSNRGMDYASQKRIEANGFKIQSVETNTRVFDFKSGENINGFESMAGKVGQWPVPVELERLLCNQSKFA